MRHCAFCDGPLDEGIPDAPTAGRRHAYDPERGRLWEICPRCLRWNPVPLELRWETVEGWERAVRDRGRILLDAEELALIRVDDGEVVRVGAPPFVGWGGWRYGDRLPTPEPPRPGFLARILGGLPPPPLEGYDPYLFGGSLGGVAGKGSASRWLGSPFLARAHPLTLAFTSVPFAPACPSCGGVMPLHPWAFHQVGFVDAGVEAHGGGEGGRGSAARGDGAGGRGLEAGRGGPDASIQPVAGVAIEAACALCGDLVLLPVDAARPALRLGLAILDAGVEARGVGEEAGRRLDGLGGVGVLLKGLAGVRASVGDLGVTERVALAIALDARAETEALAREWREVEEITAIMDGELTEVPGFAAFRARVLGGG